MERACEQNILFMAMAGGAQPSYDELRHCARRLEASAAKLLELHQRQDIEAPTQDFNAQTQPRGNTKGEEIKANLTDPDSAKMLTNKEAIPGYAAQAAVDKASQIIVAADVLGSGSEQSMLMPMIQKASVFGHAQS